MGAVFDLGEAAADSGLAPELVLVEADGTYLAALRGGGRPLRGQTRVFYTGKDRAGGRRRRRWHLLNKGC